MQNVLLVQVTDNDLAYIRSLKLISYKNDYVNSNNDGRHLGTPKNIHDFELEILKVNMYSIFKLHGNPTPRTNTIF